MGNSPTTEEKVDNLKIRVERYRKFTRLFNDELFKEWVELLKKKKVRYDDIRNDYPKAGDVKYAVQEHKDDKGNITGRTRVPYIITKEHQLAHIDEYTTRINELDLVIDIPLLMERDAREAQFHIDKLSKTIKKKTAD